MIQKCPKTRKPCYDNPDEAEAGALSAGLSVGQYKVYYCSECGSTHFSPNNLPGVAK